MGDDAWLFLVCAVVLTVGGWYFQLRIVRSSFWGIEGDTWQNAVACLYMLTVGAAWVFVFMALGGAFTRFMFGSWLDDESNLHVFIRLVAGTVSMFGFVGTAARWAWIRGYNCAKQESKPSLSGPFDF